MLEEIRDDEDIDNMEFDPEDFDPRNPFAKSNKTDGRQVLVPVESSSNTPPGSSRSSSSPQPQSSASSYQPRKPPAGPFVQKEDMEAFKEWKVIYPVYFDINKTRAEGRRVTKDLAIENPIAENLLFALRSIGLRSVFETEKTHPRDWSNPGRIRVELENSTNMIVKNKSHLYRLVGEYLKTHPTTKEMPLQSPVYHQIKSQIGDMEIEPVPLAVPTGWKINTILPVSSRAISGGEASEDMMQQMQNQMMPGLNMPPEPKAKKMKVRMRA